MLKAPAVITFKLFSIVNKVCIFIFSLRNLGGLFMLPEVIVFQKLLPVI